MGGAHEASEHAEHAEHAAGSNKRIALLIAVLALCLAFSETLGKSAQTEALALNIEASNLWSFFQAKTVRMTVVRTASEGLAAAPQGSEPQKPAQTQVEKWNAVAARYDDEPETGEGRKQLSARAQAAEHKRDLAMARYHQYELASAAFQIAIVLASAAIITGMMVLGVLSGALGVIGVAMTALGVFAPHALHLL